MPAPCVTTTRIRNHLESLRTTVLALSTDDLLAASFVRATPKDPNSPIVPVLPSKFLEDNKIHLSSFDFKLLERDGGSKAYPPILFRPRHSGVFAQYPLDMQQVAELEYGFVDYPDPNADPSTYDPMEKDPWDRGMWLLEYLLRFAVLDFPRNLPSGMIDIGQLFGIALIAMPHPIDEGTFGFHCVDTDKRNIWQSSLLDYFLPAEKWSPFPHLIMVTVNTCTGVEGFMTQGELAAIVTGMRNRSRQPSSFEPDPNYVNDPFNDYVKAPRPPGADAEGPVDREGLQFKCEERFPILMVSIVAPHHARIYYACMDGPTKLVIRQSRLYSFAKEAEAPVDFFGRVLLSEPLEERAFSI